MKTTKVSANPLMGALIFLLLVTLGAMGYAIITDDEPVWNNFGILAAVGGIVLVAIIAMMMIRDARNRLADLASQVTEAEADSSTRSGPWMLLWRSSHMALS